MGKLMNMSEVSAYTSLSRAAINRCREIGDFPQAVQLTGSRIGFFVCEVDEWLKGRPRKKGPEVNDNKRRVRCPQTHEELEVAYQQECAELKANKRKQASGR
jgi:predicted DNA-binding transcriptional regulator AlpA